MCDSRIIISKDQHRLYFNIADRELLSLPQFCHRFRLNIIKAAQRMLGGMTLVQALFSTGNCHEPDTGGDVEPFSVSDCDSLAQLCRRAAGISYQTVKSRIRCGWDLPDAFGLPGKPLSDLRFRWENYEVITISSDNPAVFSERKLGLALNN